nr:hypothetical protein [Verrucomicrobium spinosum]
MPISSQKAVRWILEPVDPEVLASLRSTTLGATLPPLLVRLLALRGLATEAQAKGFLQPRLAELGDPFILPQMRQAVDRILLAVDRQEQVVLYGDYDVDGVTSLTLMTLVLQAYGLQPHASSLCAWRKATALAMTASSAALKSTASPPSLSPWTAAPSLWQRPTGSSKKEWTASSWTTTNPPTACPPVWRW